MKMVLPLAIFLLALPCCDNGTAEPAEAPAATEHQEAAAPGSGAAGTEGTEVAQADVPSPERYPNLLFQLLNDEERTRYVALAEAELCPCETVESLDACLQRTDVCELGLQAGATMMRLVKEGAEDVEITDQVQQMIANARRVWEFELGDTPCVGPEDAAITMVNFSDFECPHCREFTHVLDAVREAHSESVRVCYKQFPLGNHRNAAAAAYGALAAHQQGQFLAFHDVIFESQSALSAADDPAAFLVAMANRVGLNVDRFVEAANDEAVRAQVERDRREGMEAGIMSTPTLYFNGVRMMEGYTVEELTARVEAALGN